MNKEKMRIAQINTCSYGSTGGIAKKIHAELSEQGHESLFAYGFGPDVNHKSVKISNKVSGLVHKVISEFIGLHGYASVISTIKLVKKLKKFKPDIIHLHNLHGGYINLKILFDYIKKENIKTVITLHDCWLFTGKCYHYYEARCDKYLHNCGNCPQLSMYPKSKFFDFTTKMLNDKKNLFKGIKNLHIVTVSQWLKEQAQATFLGRFPISVVSNGVNDVFRVTNSTEQTEVTDKIKGKFVILSVASVWDEHKGMKDIEDLSLRLADDEVILVVGKITNKKPLPDNIITIDRTENIEKLVEIYNAADVYVSMSTEETFGLTIAEALCCGVPAIVYNATACREMVENGKNGYVAQPHNIEQVYEYIQNIKADSFTCERMSVFFKEKYSGKKMIEGYFNVYANLYNI